MFDFFITKAHADGIAGFGSEFSVMSFLPFVLIIAIMYFLIIRPQSKRAKEHKAMIDGIKRGDKVITSGGLIGTVSSVVDQNEVLVELAKDIEVRVVRSSISQVLSKTGAIVGSEAGQEKGSSTSDVKQLIQKKTGQKASKKK